jgi:hypothetical protein
MSMQDRPARPGRTKPVPTADAGVDPVDYRPSSTPAPATLVDSTPLAEKTKVTAPESEAERSTPSASTAAPAGGPQATVQLGVNVDPDIAQLVMQVKARTGLSKRAIVEKAIRETWK